MKLKIFVLFLIIFQQNCSFEQKATANEPSTQQSKEVIIGAERVEEYLPMLENKKVAMVVNQTSIIGETHLVDSLLNRNIEIVKVFAPEHGFRGQADAGEKLTDGLDPQTGIPIVSLYGKKRKPSPEDLAGIDLVIYDIQDVGVRFYTYISTMTLMMEACAELGIPILVLDRPNPNGHYVDGPVLDTAWRSFVGMHPVPIVHGMTSGEFAKMINGEGWMETDGKCKLSVITCLNYDHNTLYELPVKPSPNLPNPRSIYLYPSICFFEGTVLSEGRGTNKQFQLYGHPELPDSGFSFTPKPMPGAKYPKLDGELCYGEDLTKVPLNSIINEGLTLKYFLKAYKEFPDKEAFFLKTNFFEKLAGGEALRLQVISGKTEEEIKATWQEGLLEYKEIRSRYTLYPDFEK